jgi:hypothetical protein
MRQVAARTFARALLGSVVLGAPFALSAHAASALVGPLTQRAVTLLMGVTAPLAASLPAPAELQAEPPCDAPSSSSELRFDAATKSNAHRGFKSAPKAKPAALFVSAATVLKLAQSNARPRGSFVGATAQHPAGLRLTGVAALGIGVQDGDILTEALGIAPHGPGEIIGAIIEARAKQARFLSGTLWRQGESFSLTVEQPYVPARSPS